MAIHSDHSQTQSDPYPDFPGKDEFVGVGGWRGDVFFPCCVFSDVCNISL